MKFIRKNLSNILFVLFALFLFTPYGLPVRALLIKGVSVVTTSVFNIEVDASEREKLESYNWKLITMSGENMDFQSLEKKVILVNFWATWCPPCVAEMPGMQKLYDDYGDRVAFVFVARDEQGRVEEFLKKKNLNLPVYYERTAPPELLSTSSLPTTYLIDTQGMIRVDKVGAADWNSKKVRSLLDELIQ
ncbi:MAG: TlpA disulfide reductase family protein [Lutimonas sp.]